MRKLVTSIWSDTLAADATFQDTKMICIRACMHVSTHRVRWLPYIDCFTIASTAIHLFKCRKKKFGISSKVWFRIYEIAKFMPIDDSDKFSCRLILFPFGDDDDDDDVMMVTEAAVTWVVLYLHCFFEGGPKWCANLLLFGFPCHSKAVFHLCNASSIPKHTLAKII